MKNQHFWPRGVLKIIIFSSFDASINWLFLTSVLASILMPFWLRFASFSVVKMNPNWAHTPVHVHVQHVHVHVHVHVHGLGCVWARFGTPKAPQEVSKSTPKSAQSGPRSAQERQRAGKRNPKWTGPPKKHFKRYPKASLSFYNPFIISLSVYIYIHIYIYI